MTRGCKRRVSWPWRFYSGIRIRLQWIGSIVQIRVTEAMRMMKMTKRVCLWRIMKRASSAQYYPKSKCIGCLNIIDYWESEKMIRVSHWKGACLVQLKISLKAIGKRVLIIPQLIKCNLGQMENRAWRLRDCLNWEVVAMKKENFL